MDDQSLVLASRAAAGSPRMSDVAEPAAPDTDVEVEEKKETEEHLDEPWSVILYNDDVHTFDEVITQLIKATGCSSAEAEKLAWTVHTEGKATVYEGPFEECFEVQSILREIELVTEIKG
jgi:ATP-dependent Clp protease adapter protein ClpS